MSDTRDAYDLSDEDYQNAINNPDSFFDQADDEDQDQSVGYDPNADDQDQDQDDQDQDQDDQDQSQDQDVGDPDFAKKPDTQKITLIHNGQTIEVSQQEAVNLAQKGYDYEKKTAQIAPHRRLIELVEGDEELQEIINRHVVKRTLPKPSKREDFESEDEWFQDNMERIMAKTTPVVSKSEPDATQQSQQTPTGQVQESPVVRALRSRDPQNFETVKPHLVKAIQNLKVEDYARITQSATEVVKFYDQVKNQVVGQRQQGARPAARRTGPKSFNLRGGSAPSRTPAKKNVWELSNKDFNSQLRKAKGY